MKKFAVLTLALAVGGCASTGTNPDGTPRESKATTGAVLGAVAGAIAGYQANKDQGALVGAVAGGAAGYAIGHSMDEKEKELRNIADERDQKGMEVERLKKDMLRVTVSSEASFDVDRAVVRPEFKPTLDKVAGVLRDDPGVRIKVVGHTDSTGSDQYNQQLSERRAQAVADYLVSRGVSYNQITTEGRGESEPRASNDTAAGRAQNRRVEILVKETGSSTQPASGSGW